MSRTAKVRWWVFWAAGLALTGGGCAAGTGQGPAAQGAAAVAREDWKTAFFAFSAAVSQQPQRLDLRRERVRAAHLSGQLVGLRHDLSAAVRSRPDDPAGRYEFALAVAAAGEPGSDRQALQLLAEVARQVPEEAEPWYRMGLLRLEQESYAAAAAALTRAVELAPQQTTPRVALAAALAGQGDARGARVALTPLPDLQPSARDLERARLVLEDINLPQQRVPQALQDRYRQAVGALSEEEGGNGEALQIIEEALAILPECQPFLVLDGLARVRMGATGPARARLWRAAELEPGDPTAWMELALLEAANEEWAAAEEHLEAGLRADPLSVDLWAELGRVRYQARRYDQAAEAFRRLVAVDGASLVSQLWLGRSLRRAGQDHRAEAVYLAVLERFPRNFEACVQLGHIYRGRRLREPDRRRSEELLEQALRYYRLALVSRPEDPLVQRVLAALEQREIGE